MQKSNLPIDENQFFREATLKICSSLNLQRAMERSLGYIQQFIPVDCLHIGLYDPDLEAMRTLVRIAPNDWPHVPEIMQIPVEAMALVLEKWRAKPTYGVANDMRTEEPEVQLLWRQIWPETASLLHIDLDLESRRIGVLILTARGRQRYQEAHARRMHLLNEPFSIAVANALQHQETVRLKEMLEDDNRYLYRELRHATGDTIIGADFGLKGVFQMIRQVAPLDSPVLLLGETGTGKELFANAIHAASPRHNGPMIKVNCGGLPESLLDSELFGHEKGAFTGATSQKRGRFERARGGTIFLDEIGELPLAAQVKLLRVLQNKEIERVGGSATIPVDVRIISATHRNLENMVSQRQFREDLWFRLNVFPVIIPPLRQRPQDLPALVEHLITKKCREMKISRSIRLAPGTLEMLKQHAWPGNVRELQNLVERALIQAQTRGTQSLRLDLDPKGWLQSPNALGEDIQTEIVPFETAAARHIISALKQSGGKIIGPGGAAELLRLHPSTLRGKMRKLNIQALKGKKRNRG